jgi:cellobiose-specific phosphotransferase system component IIA
MKTSKILVYGQSEMTTLLVHATDTLGSADNKKSHSNAYIMMVRREIEKKVQFFTLKNK